MSKRKPWYTEDGNTRIVRRIKWVKRSFPHAISKSGGRKRKRRLKWVSKTREIAVVVFVFKGVVSEQKV